MPFIQVDIKQEIEKHCQESPSFAKAWNDSREEYALIGEMISLRKAGKRRLSLPLFNQNIGFPSNE